MIRIPHRRDQAPRILLTPKEAAQALALCTKTLAALTEAGELPVVVIREAPPRSKDAKRDRVQRTIRYALADLQHWVDSKRQGRRPLENPPADGRLEEASQRPV